MVTNLISRLHRMRDSGPEETEASRGIAKRITAALDDRGFATLDTPVIERTELFVRKSGGEISGNLYTFSDPGGIGVSLRPEFTPSVIRWFIENMPGYGDPVRFQYSGPVFRYGGSRGARFRQFHQVGGELIGVEGTDGDIEVLLAANECIRIAGVNGAALRLGHVGVIRELVRSIGLTEPLQMLVISSLSEVLGTPAWIRRIEARATAAGLILGEPDDSHPDSGDDHATQVALEVIRNSLPSTTGRRSPDQILSRLVTRLEQAVPLSVFQLAIEAVVELVTIDGTARRVAAEARHIFERTGAPTECIDELEDTLVALNDAGVGEATILLDLAFVRGLAYYTGIVFEFISGSSGGEFALGGGGRYDDLVRAFGGADVPACGFALNVDELTWLTAAQRLQARR